MFDSLLVANRGEIAVRVLRTARRLGLRTVAVYSEADAHAMHVQLADEALCIGPPPASQSYLRIDAILAAAERSAAAAIHPGYGFLSESAEFAAACAEAGRIFVGPPAAAIRAMGSKSESKRLMAAAGVPLVPGYHGEDQSFERLRTEAAQIGYPVLVKASAGGGGKGMRIVDSAAALREAVEAARREAQAAFGDPTLLLEKYFERARHVEVQVFADRQGQCIALFDRDCSMQRRHQKVIEEAPAPGIPDALRAQMIEAAVSAARAVDYVGAGTVEFLYAEQQFHFIEMNTRLQVEHPVTEMITGVDLVEWQLRVAAGEALPVDSLPTRPGGHAIEARIYAEDPSQGFLPSPGRLLHWKFPEPDPQLRIDTGVRSGDEITVHYDPLIAKLIVHDADRPSALRRLLRALEACEIAGVTTNLALLRQIALDADFTAGALDTRLIATRDLAAKAAPGDPPAAIVALVMLHALNGAVADKASASPSYSPWCSPWAARDGWRLNQPPRIECQLESAKRLWSAQIAPTCQGAKVQIDAQTLVIEQLAIEQLAINAAQITATIDGSHFALTCLARPDGAVIAIQRYRSWTLRPRQALARPRSASGDSGCVRSPMPGVVVSVHVAVGEQVAAHAPLIAVEAMKMEHTLRAAAAGTVLAVHFSVGDRVEEGVELVTLSPK